MNELYLDEIQTEIRESYPSYTWMLTQVLGPRAEEPLRVSVPDPKGNGKFKHFPNVDVLTGPREPKSLHNLTGERYRTYDGDGQRRVDVTFSATPH